MSVREQIQKAYQEATAYAKVADQLEAMVPVVRTPADRSKVQGQQAILADTDCDVKLPSMIVVEHLPKAVADQVCQRLRAELVSMASVYRDVALNTLRGSSNDSVSA